MKKILLFLSLLISITLFATEPEGYYSSAENKANNTLRLALQSIIKNHTVISYNNLYNVYLSSDIDSAGYIWDIYSTCQFIPGTDENHSGAASSVCESYNREHTVPKSWFNEQSPMVSDAFHIYPTDTKVNSQRGNYPYGECSNGISLGGHALGKLGTSTFSGYTGTVFEPVDQYKGDLARTYFYMATCYAGKTLNIGNGSVVFTSDANLTNYADSLFMKWTREDAVSQKEITRNDSIYKVQGNRNPFIDHPELAEYIWGNKKGQVWHESSTGITPVYTVTVSVYPIPASTYITISSTATDKINYQIYSIQGVLLEQGTTPTRQQVDISSLTDGIYLLKTTVNDQTSIHKIVVNR